MRFEADFPAVPRGVTAARGQVRAVAEACGLAESQVDSVALAVSEAVTNAVLHARASKVSVSAERQNGELRVVVADDGTGLRPRPDSPGLGLGLPIMASVAGRMEVVSRPGRTEIHLAFPC